MKTTAEKINTALDGLTDIDYPHLFSFANKARLSGSTTPKCRAKIDLFAFRSGYGFKALPDLSTPELIESHSGLASDTTSVLLIGENIDLELIHDLRALIGHNNASFARFLDDFLNDLPSYNFDQDVALHLPQFHSKKKRHGHLNFHYYHFREFERRLEVSYQDVQIAAKKEYWRRKSSYGAMHPCQRLLFEEGETQFPPLFIGRNHCVVWFDADMNCGWKTGVILVEPTMNITTLPVSLSPPLYMNLVSRDVVPNPASQPSYRTALTALTTHALQRDGAFPNPPPPFALLEGINRILVAEWMVIHTYCIRDINTIEWRLQGGHGDGFKSTKQFEDVLGILFRMRRRLNRYCGLVGEQRAICAARGSNLSTPWIGHNTVLPKSVDDAWNDLVADYDQVLGLLQEDFERVQQDINYIASLLTIQQTGVGVREAERTTEQNRMVLVLAIVATFLLPIGTAATVLGMEGDWAPSGSNFGLFWAISVPVSLVFMVGMLAFMFWGGQRGKVPPASREIKGGTESSGDGTDTGGGNDGWRWCYPDSKWVFKRRTIISEREVSSQGV
ncbi:hypothetical protein B0T18DRAFT_415547 [Schizothecium vesticola]|uniref:Cora-domain-containing protein n=1 Tax=Schizothecium vesticola TaxID=314040 RepID=A0AA40EQF6_9PEZI|nr:hypothetical protein B0T18DRAFT_415547 [Schizothecium vesticola]